MRLPQDAVRLVMKGRLKNAEILLHVEPGAPAAAKEAAKKTAALEIAKFIIDTGAFHQDGEEPDVFTVWVLVPEGHKP